ncbi:MAG: polysaccharide biosynthesis/export family protein [Gemmatimonadota bacterium]
MRTGSLLAFAGVVLCCACGCAGGGGGAEVDASAPAERDAQPVGYLLRIGDELKVGFPTDRQLDYTAPVSPGGTITTPLGDEIVAAGRTVAEVRLRLEEHMSNYLRDPTASVVLSSVAEQPVYVLGEVGNPGAVYNPGRISVVMALAQAGGLLSTGQPSSVMVVRTTGVEEPVSFKVDVTKVLSGGDMSVDMELMPYDIVFVPKSVIGKVGEFVELFFEQLAPAQLFYLRGYDILNRGPVKLYQ